MADGLRVLFVGDPAPELEATLAAVDRGPDDITLRRCPSPQAASDIVDTEPIHAVAVNVDALESVAQLAAIEADPLPVIAVGSTPPSEQAGAVLEAGADEYLPRHNGEQWPRRLAKKLVVAGIAGRQLATDDEGSVSSESPREQIKRLHDVAVELAGCDSRERVFELMVEAGRDILDLDICVVFAVEDGRFTQVASSETLPDRGYHEPAVEDPASGAMGLAYRRQTTLCIDDVQAHPDTNPQDDYGGLISTPIGEHAVFQAGSYEVAAFDETDTELVKLLAGHVREALGRIERETTLAERRATVQHQREQIERLHEVGVDFARCTDAEAACRLMIEAAEDILKIELCLVALVRDGRFEVVAKSAAMPESGYHEPRVDAEDTGLLGKAYRTGESILHSGDPPDEAEPQAEYRSSFTVPIGEFGAFQAAASDVVAFDQTDVELVEILARHLREALQRLEHEHKLSRRREELELLRQVFARVFRHNVRNELNIIKGNATLLGDRTDEAKREAARADLLAATERLLEQTEKAREIDQVIASEQEPVTLAIRDVITTAIARSQQAYPEATIDIGVIPDVTVSVHPRFPRGVRNAIENAIEHNEDVTVTVRATREENHATIIVEDTGDGIPADEIQVIHEETVGKLRHGSGVGLWLMKWVTNKSDGELTLRNTSEGGQVRLQIPLG